MCHSKKVSVSWTCRGMTRCAERAASQKRSSSLGVCNAFGRCVEHSLVKGIFDDGWRVRVDPDQERLALAKLEPSPAGLPLPITPVLAAALAPVQTLSQPRRRFRGSERLRRKEGSRWQTVGRADGQEKPWTAGARRQRPPGHSARALLGRRSHAVLHKED